MIQLNAFFFLTPLIEVSSGNVYLAHGMLTPMQTSPSMRETEPQQQQGVSSKILEVATRS